MSSGVIYTRTIPSLICG